jgi:hypothetical protein
MRDVAPGDADAGAAFGGQRIQADGVAPWTPALRPQAIDRPVARDREQPRQEGSRARVELARPPPEREERVLDDLGRRFAVAEEAAHAAEEEAGVAVVRDHEGALVTFRDPGDKEGVVVRASLLDHRVVARARMARWSRCCHVLSTPGVRRAAQ